MNRSLFEVETKPLQRQQRIVPSKTCILPNFLSENVLLLVVHLCMFEIFEFTIRHSKKNVFNISINIHIQNNGSPWHESNIRKSEREKNHITYFDLCFAAYRLKLSRLKIMKAICLTVPHSFQCNMCKKLWHRSCIHNAVLLQHTKLFWESLQTHNVSRKNWIFRLIGFWYLFLCLLNTPNSSISLKMLVHSSGFIGAH